MKQIICFFLIFCYSAVYTQVKEKKTFDIKSYFNFLKNDNSQEIVIKPPLNQCYQYNAPALPFFSFSADIPNKGDYTLKILFTDSITISNIHFPVSKGLEKQYGQTSYYDTSYFIEAFSSEAFFPKKNFQSFAPVIARDTRKQTFHIYPFKYQERTNTLKVYTQFIVQLEKTAAGGINEIHQARAFTSTKDIFAEKDLSEFQSKYQPIGEKGELLIIYRNTSDSLIRKFAGWKAKSGVKCHFLKLDNNTIFPEGIKARIESWYDSIPDILYVLLVGEHSEIPSYLYKQVLSDDYYSDTYYGFIDGTDFAPELLVGRFSGTEAENTVLINKTIHYESYYLKDNYEKNVMLMASDQGTNIGDDNETDWEHLRGIGIYLSDSAQMQAYEYFDGSQGNSDSPGNPTATDIKNGINAGKGFIFYTGHGDFSVLNTGSFFTMHVQQLENYNKLPVVISAACNNGKYIGLNCMAEAFTFAQKNSQNTGSVAFTGSSILMSWAPPMETQDEFARLINPNSSNYKSTLGAAFYNAQLSMLEKYPTTYGEEVMQTWILFGDPTLKMRVNQKGALLAQHPSIIPYTSTSIHLLINEDNAFISLSQNDSVIAFGQSSDHSIIFSQLDLSPDFPVDIVATKSDFQTYTGQINLFRSSGEVPFKVYPNPASHTLFILGSLAVDEVQLVDVSGRIIPVNFDFSANSVNLDHLSAGVYQLVIHSNNNLYNYKIIKSHEN